MARSPALEGPARRSSGAPRRLRFGVCMAQKASASSACCVACAPRRRLEESRTLAPGTGLQRLVLRLAGSKPRTNDGPHTSAQRPSRAQSNEQANRQLPLRSGQPRLEVFQARLRDEKPEPVKKAGKSAQEQPCHGCAKDTRTAAPPGASDTSREEEREHEKSPHTGHAHALCVHRPVPTRPSDHSDSEEQQERADHVR